MTANHAVAKRILIVDDDRILCQALRLALTFDGHASEYVLDAEEALHKLQEQRYDVVLADYVLPGFDGSQLAQTIKKRGYCCLVVLMSGFLEEHSSADVDLFLHKPFDLRLLRQQIGRILNPGVWN